MPCNQPLKYHKEKSVPLFTCASDGQDGSRRGVFCKKNVLRKFAKFTGKYLCQRLFFNKVVGLRPATLLKKILWHRCFPVNFAKFLRALFFYRTPPVAASSGWIQFILRG